MESRTYHARADGTRFALVPTMMRGALLAGLLCAAACHRSTPGGATAAAPAPTAKAAHEGGEGRRQQLAAGTLEVVVNGKAAGAWSSEQLAKSSVAGTNQNGEAREYLALKTITQSLVGDKARVVALATAGERVPIEEKAWNDPARSLVLRLNHHGEYKAQWVAGGSADEAFLKGVRRIEIVQ